MPKIPYNKRKDGRYYKQITVGYDENEKRIIKTLKIYTEARINYDKVLGELNRTFE